MGIPRLKAERTALESKWDALSVEIIGFNNLISSKEAQITNLYLGSGMQRINNLPVGDLKTKMNDISLWREAIKTNDWISIGTAHATDKDTYTTIEAELHSCTVNRDNKIEDRDRIH